MMVSQETNKLNNFIQLKLLVNSSKNSPFIFWKDKDFIQRKRVSANVTAWRCGGILSSFCPQLKPIKDIKFNGSTTA